MSEESLDKNMMADESDPQRLAERAQDPDGSFLDIYRSLHAGSIDIDEYFVSKSVEHGIVPDTIRYGAMTRGTATTYRGVIKSRTGSCFYFNWPSGGEIHFAKADTPEKEWEAQRLLKHCTLGCDLRKAEDPIDSGTPLNEDVKEDEAAQKGAVGFVPSTATAPVAEDKYIQSQERLMTDQHPGSTQSQDPPPDDGQGRNWHEPLVRAQDALTPLATNDGQTHWDHARLLKAWGTHLQKTAPRVGTVVDPLESRYMVEVLGITPDQIRKGIRMAPRQMPGFVTWRSSQLRNRMDGIQSWLRNHRE